MTALLGATSVVTGLQPGVVASLVDLKIDFEDIHTVLTYEDGFQILAELTEPIEDESSEEEQGETDYAEKIDEDNWDGEEPE